MPALFCDGCPSDDCGSDDDKSLCAAKRRKSYINERDLVFLTQADPASLLLRSHPFLKFFSILDFAWNIYFDKIYSLFRSVFGGNFGVYPFFAQFVYSFVIFRCPSCSLFLYSANYI